MRDCKCTSEKSHTFGNCIRRPSLIRLQNGTVERIEYYGIELAMVARLTRLASDFNAHRHGSSIPNAKKKRKFVLQASAPICELYRINTSIGRRKGL